MPRGQSLWPLDRGRYPVVTSTTSRSVRNRLRPSAKEAKTAGRDAVGSPQEDETNVCSACPSGRPYRRAALSPWSVVSVAYLLVFVTVNLLQVLSAYQGFFCVLSLLLLIDFQQLKRCVYKSRLWNVLSRLVDSCVDSSNAVDQQWHTEKVAQTGCCRHQNKEHDDAADGRPTVGKSLQDDDSRELSGDGRLPGGRNTRVSHSSSDVPSMSKAKKRHFVRRYLQRLSLMSPGALSKSNVSCRSSRSRVGATGSCTSPSLLTQENLTEAAGLEDARQILKLPETDDKRNMVETVDIENFTKAAADMKIFSDALETRNAASGNSGLSKRLPENGSNPNFHVRPVKEINPPAEFTENVSDANVPTKESNLLLKFVEGSMKSSAENQQENEISTTTNCHVHMPKGLVRDNVNDKALDAQDTGPSEQKQVSAGLPHLLLSSDANRANSDANTKMSMSHAAEKNGRTERPKEATFCLEDMYERKRRVADDGQKDVSDVCLHEGGRASEAAVSQIEAESTDDVWQNEQGYSAVSKSHAGGKDKSGKGNGRQPKAEGSAQTSQGRASSSRSDGGSTAGSFGSSGSSGGGDDDKGKKDDNKNKDTGLMNIVRKKKKKKTKRQKSAGGTKETGSIENMGSDIANDASAQMDNTGHRPSSTAPGPTDEQLSGDSTVNHTDLTTTTYSASDPGDGNDACASTLRDVRALPLSSGTNAAADASATYLSEGPALPDQPPEDPEQCVSWRPQVVDCRSPSDDDDEKRENAVVKLPVQCQEDLTRAPDQPCCWQPSSDSDESVNFCSPDEALCPHVTTEHSAEPVDITGANDVAREEVELKTPKQCTEDLARDISAHSTASPGVVQPHNATHGQQTLRSPMNIRYNVVLVDKCHQDWLRGMLRHLLEENWLLSRRRLCQKCRANKFALVLCPCGHLLCHLCGHNQMLCPVCRVTVELENKAAFF